MRVSVCGGSGLGLLCVAVAVEGTKVPSQPRPKRQIFKIPGVDSESSMAQWLQALPEFTQPPILAQVPARPRIEITESAGSQPEGLRLTIDHANLPKPLHFDLQWQRVISCRAVTPAEPWATVMTNFVHHPEVNSTNILRADILADAQAEQKPDPSTAPWRVTRRVLRRLLPRKPGANANLDQLCTFYISEDEQSHLVVYTPLIQTIKTTQFTSTSAIDDLDRYLETCSSPEIPADVPFYHPALLALAFAYEGTPFEDVSAPSLESDRGAATLSISILPFPSLEKTAQLSRICSSLLTTIYRHCWGRYHDYKPRVEHDRLTAKDLFQDVYLNVKHRWAKYIITNWKEGTDAEKHVHEDVALAAWLMTFWKTRLGDTAEQSPEAASLGLQDRPWLTNPDSWPRPSGGFVDVGCGNGLLVWLLNNEGYDGHGFDLRPRKSWALLQTGPSSGCEAHQSTTEKQSIPVHYPSLDPLRGETVEVDITAADLRVHTLEAFDEMQKGLDSAPEPSKQSSASEMFPAGCFLIGNHADEITPLIPLLATLVVPSCSGMLNIPCCPWMVEGTRFTRAHYRVRREEVAQLLGLLDPSEEDATAAGGDDDTNQSGRPSTPITDDIASAGSHATMAELVREEMAEIGLGPPVDPPATGKTQSKAGAHNLGGGSKNVAYLTYVSHLHLTAGWHVEKEALRIPSTKNWAVVSTRRVINDFDDSDQSLRRIRARQSQKCRLQSMIQRAQATWTARDPASEGKWFLEASREPNNH